MEVSTTDWDTTMGLTDIQMDELFKQAVREELKMRKQLGLPTARFDKETGTAYLEWPDGTKELV